MRSMIYQKSELPLELQDRLGIITVSKGLLLRQKDFFLNVIIVDIESHFPHNIIEYLCLSTEFDVVKEGESIPYYEIHYKECRCGHRCMRFQKREK